MLNISDNYADLCLIPDRIYLVAINQWFSEWTREPLVCSRAGLIDRVVGLSRGDWFEVDIVDATVSGMLGCRGQIIIEIRYVGSGPSLYVARLKAEVIREAYFADFYRVKGAECPDATRKLRYAEEKLRHAKSLLAELN